MPHRTMRTTPEILAEMVLRHATCMRWICVTATTLTEGSMEPDVMANYVRNVRQAECIARFLHTPIRKDDPSSSAFPHSLQGGLTGVFLEMNDEDGFLIEEHLMSHSSPMQGLMKKAVGEVADGWKLIGIKC